MLKKLVAVEIMRHLVTHDWHGYSQGMRWGDGEGTCDLNIGGKVYKTEQGDRDCSSAVISAYQDAGIDCGGATYTGNMRQCMCGTGNFVWHPMSSGFVAQAGDIYLNEVNHTAMCLSAEPDMLMEFSISENGTIYGATGDQTGNESAIRTYYDYPWDGILECVNKEEAGNDNSIVPVDSVINADVVSGSMCAIIVVAGRDEQYYLDGHSIRPFATPVEVVAMQTLYKKTVGKDLQVLKYNSAEEFENVRKVFDR